MLESIIFLFVGAATFIVGMNMMSSGLKKSTGKGVKRLFKKTANNRFISMGIGAATTALIQSSAATSIMVIGFISAGVMTIFQGVSTILGAYIGTTVTGLLVSLSSLPISKFLLLVIVPGVILTFFKKDTYKNIGEILAGLGILFVGLELMKMAFPQDGELTDVVKDIIEVTKNPFLLLLIGALFTALVQSSSATSGIVIVMVGTGAINIGAGFYIVLGATIGTVITTLIASIGGNANVKRTAYICLFIRIICALIGTIITIIFEKQFVSFFSGVFGLQFGLALFLIFYNIIFMFAILPFLESIIKLFIKLIVDKDLEKKQSALKYIDKRLLNTPSIAQMQVKLEIANMMQKSYENYLRGYQRLVYNDTSVDKELIDTEEAIDYMNEAISDFLIPLTNKVTYADEKKVGSYFHVINDIERIGDHAYNFYELSLKMNENDLNFSQTAIDEFEQMNSILKQMFELSLEIFKKHDKSKLTKLHELENITDSLKTSLSDNHYARITRNECKTELSPFYSNLISELERVADHLVNIGYSIINPTGSDE